MKKCMKRILIFFLVCMLIFLIPTGVITYQGYQRYVQVMEEKTLDEKIDEIQSKPNYTKLQDLPQIYLDAVISVEDKRFYQHYGIDPISLVRAIRNNLRAKALIEGGSTITQQLAKNLYFDDEASLVRKAAEAMVTVVLEERYSKDEILELYVNCIYFGESYYCVYDASIGYFQKIPSQMTDFEATMLAGIPNAPSAYAPTVNMNLAVKRQEKVLESMVREGYLTEQEADIIQISGK
jgi:monofunctional glycosyltransferase